MPLYHSKQLLSPLKFTAHSHPRRLVIFEESECVSKSGIWNDIGDIYATKSILRKHKYHQAPQAMPDLPNIVLNLGFFGTILFAIVLRIEVTDTEL